MQEELYATHYARITYEAPQDFLFLELSGVLEGDIYRETFNMLLQYGLEKNAKKLLVNQAPMQKSSMEAKAWLITSWFPQVKKAFHEDMKVAIVLSTNLFNKIGGEFVVSTIRNTSKFDVKTFTNLGEAQTWLKLDDPINPSQKS